MVSLGDVKRWNAAVLEDVQHTLRQRLDVLTSSGEDFAKVLPVEGWEGAAADNAASAHQSLVWPLDHLVAGVSAITKGGRAGLRRHSGGPARDQRGRGTGPQVRLPGRRGRFADRCAHQPRSIRSDPG
jgi:hypothetical protein